MALIDYALTTVDRAKDYIGEDSYSSADDTFIEAMINIATNFVEDYTGRRFKKTTYTNEIHDGTGGESITLDHYPIMEGESFKLEYRDSSSNTDSWEEEDTEDYFVYYDEGIVTLTGGGKFKRRRRNWRVSYTAGYDFDNTTTYLGDTKAGDVELVTWMIVSDMFYNRKEGKSVKSESVGDYSVTYGGMEDYFKSADGTEKSLIQTTLDKYKRLESASALTPSIY